MAKHPQYPLLEGRYYRNVLNVMQYFLSFPLSGHSIYWMYWVFNVNFAEFKAARTLLFCGTNIRGGPAQTAMCSTPA